MKKIFKILVVIVLVIISCNVVQSYNLNGFKLAHFHEGRTKVSRDSKVKYNGEWSYKIESQDYNDYMIYKTIEVKKNTAYKVSCMVKTKNVEAEEKLGGGFNIGLKDSLEKSASIYGTNDWTELTFYFNSKNNEFVDIAFRLGDNNQNCKGTAWFSDIKLEVGRKKKTANWNFAVFMINNTQLEVNGQKISEQLSNPQENIIENSFIGFKETLEDFTNNNIKVDYDIISIDKPLTHVSYDTKSGYYISREDSYELINEYIYGNEQYDHIFVVANIGDKISTDELEWIGLGGMLYDNIGYSNIRISDASMRSYVTSYLNYFPEEVILHEFLHTLERNSIRLGYETIALHDYKEYGYRNDARYGQKDWYRDYLLNRVPNTNNGIRQEIYYTQPVSKKNFNKKEDITEIINKSDNFIQRISEKISKII